MIDSALKYVVQDLNAYFQRRIVPAPRKDMAVLSVIVDQLGEMAVEQDNAVIVMPVSIGEEKIFGAGVKRKMQPGPDGDFSAKQGTVNLDLYLLFCSYFPGKMTAEALFFNSMVIMFFQEKPLFSQANSPGLDSTVNRIGFELFNLSFMEQSNLWGSLGAKYMPSVLFKARLQLNSGGQTLARIPAIRSTDTGNRN